MRNFLGYRHQDIGGSQQIQNTEDDLSTNFAHEQEIFSHDNPLSNKPPHTISTSIDVKYIDQYIKYENTSKLNRNFNQNKINKVFPPGLNFSSGNFNPVHSWNLGFQVVAMNYQKPDVYMNLNDGFFNSQAPYSTGYVKKPSLVDLDLGQTRGTFMQKSLGDSLMHTLTHLGSNLTKPNKSSYLVPTKENPIRLSVRILGAFWIQTETDRESRPDIKASVQLWPGTPYKDNKHNKDKEFKEDDFKTQDNNGIFMTWKGKKIKKKDIFLVEDSVSMLRFLLKDEDKNVVAQASLPMSSLKGYQQAKHKNRPEVEEKGFLTHLTTNDGNILPRSSLYVSIVWNPEKFKIEQ